MTMPATLRFHHGAVSVPDLEAAIEWYSRYFQFSIERRFEIPGQQTRGAMLNCGGVRVELLEAKGSKQPHPNRREPNLDFRTQGNLHFAFAVKDVHAFAQRLATQGADVVWVRDFEFGSAAFIRDNAGNLI